MRILFGCEQDGSPQARQRAQTPAVGLTRLGHTVRVSSVTLHPMSGQYGTAIRGLDIDGRPTTAREAEIVVLRLVDQDESASIKAARADGQIVIFDWDDDVWHLPEWNPAAKTLKRSGRFIDAQTRVMPPPDLGRSVDLDYLERNMNACDAVVASTPALAQVILEQLSERFDMSPPVYVCRNGVDPALYKPTPEHKPIRVGWLGSIGYVAEALRSIAPAVVDALEDNDQPVEFWHLGATGIGEVAQILGLTGFPIMGRPWVPSSELPRMLEDIDLAIVPRIPCEFTEAQSAMTGLSLAAAGVPFVASPTAEYRSLAEKGCGFTAETEDDWHHVLKALLQYQPLRASSRGRGLELAVAEHGPIPTARHYVDMFERVQRARAA